MPSMSCNVLSIKIKLNFLFGFKFYSSINDNKHVFLSEELSSKLTFNKSIL